MTNAVAVRPRLDFTPVERHVARSFHVDHWIGDNGSIVDSLTACPWTHRPSDGDIARVLGRNRGVVLRWRQDGVPLYTADQLAVALGCHVLDLWPDYHEVEYP